MTGSFSRLLNLLVLIFNNFNIRTAVNSQSGVKTPAAGIMTCKLINIIAKKEQNYLVNFLTTMDYSPCPEREIWPFLKGSHIYETGGVTPTKTGVHARDIDP